MLKYMDYAYAVYQEKSFTKAAEKLYISQPALSLTIKKLEKELGYPVFERCGKEVALTPVGEKYIRAIEAVMDIREELRQGIDDLMELRSGRISIACATVISSYVLPGLIKDFRAVYPGVEFEVTVCETAVKELSAEKRPADIAIGGAFVRSAQVEYVPWFREHLILAVPAELEINRRLKQLQLPAAEVLAGTFDYANAPLTDIRDFGEEDFIMLREPNPLSSNTRALLQGQNVWPRAVMEFEHVITALNYAECGFGCCFTTDLALRYKGRVRDLALYLPRDAENDRQVYLMYGKNKYLSAAAREFIRFAERRGVAVDAGASME